MSAKKSSALVITSQTQAETVLGELKARTLTRNSSQIKLDALRTRLAARFEPKIKELNSAIAADEKALEKWAESARAEWGDKKSIEFLYGVLGFRMGNRTAKTRSGWNWDGVLKNLVQLIKQKKFEFKKYLRVKFEVNKEQILADSTAEAGILTTEKLEELGVKVVQEEGFFIDLK